MPPRRSCGAGIEMDPRANFSDRTTDRLADTATFLVTQGRLNVIWLDVAYTVRHVVGSLAAFVQPNVSIIDSIPALLGHEDAFAALRAHPGDALDIPNVAMIGPDGPTPKLNISVFWRAESQDYVVLLGPVLVTQMPDLENLVRGRLIAEEKLRQTTAELERINRDLEEFAYIISHDLKAPLRALKFLSSDVVEALDQEPADLEGASKASRDIIAQSKRMSSMLLGLLEYAQIGRKAEAVERVDTRQLANDIVASSGAAKSMHVQLTGAWPVVETLAVPLDLVLRNLVSNAIKHHDRLTGLIEIHAGTRDAFFTFAVIDDGPGIDSAWHDAIFLPFRTIDDSSTGHPDSSGIGLALVKRAIEAAGGHIELTSNPVQQRGATFTVLWPKSFVKTL
jgi:signal transduction histidine kinase